MNKIIIPKKLVLVDDEFIGKGEYSGQYYIGMNYWASQEIGCDFPFPKDTAVVVKRVALDSGGWNRGFGIPEVFLHEQQESQFMQLGCDYPDAHARTAALCGPTIEPPVINHKDVLKLVRK